MNQMELEGHDSKLYLALKLFLAYTANSVAHYELLS